MGIGDMDFCVLILFIQGKYIRFTFAVHSTMFIVWCGEWMIGVQYGEFEQFLKDL